MHLKDQITVALLLVVLALCIHSVFIDKNSTVYHDSWIVPIVLATILSFYWD
jgi:uncharacterized membrane protein